MGQVSITDPKLKGCYFQLSEKDIYKLSEVRKAYRQDLTGASKSQTVSMAIDHVFNHIANGEEF